MREKAIVGGAVAAGFLASLCCVGPLVFVLLGLGTFGVGAFLASARPFLMGGSVLMLALGFYWTYLRGTENCGSGESCTDRPAKHLSRVVLWLASIGVLAFALLPYLAGPLAAKISEKKIPNGQSNQSVSQSTGNMVSAGPVDGIEIATFKVEGMTCVTCETAIRLALKRSPGVVRADVSYANGTARVEYDPHKTTPDKLREAINTTGYKAH